MTDDRPLFLDQLLDAVIGEIEQRVERIAIEWLPFGRPLDLDEPPLAGLDDVHVHFGA